jgi:ATP-binding cassette subfamily B protein
LFNGYKKEFDGYSDLALNLHKIRRFTWDMNAKFYALQSFLMIILEVGIFYFAIKLWAKNILTIGDFVLIQSYVLTVIMMVWDFGKIINRIYERLAEAEEMTIILNLPHEIVDDINASDLEVNFGRIKFDKVNFAYDNNEKVIYYFGV